MTLSMSAVCACLGTTRNGLGGCLTNVGLIIHLYLLCRVCVSVADAIDAEVSTFAADQESLEHLVGLHCIVCVCVCMCGGMWM